MGVAVGAVAVGNRLAGYIIPKCIEIGAINVALRSRSSQTTGDRGSVDSAIEKIHNADIPFRRPA